MTEDELAELQDITMPGSAPGSSARYVVSAVQVESWDAPAEDTARTLTISFNHPSVEALVSTHNDTFLIHKTAAHRDLHAKDSLEAFVCDQLGADCSELGGGDDDPTASCPSTLPVNTSSNFIKLFPPEDDDNEVAPAAGSRVRKTAKQRARDSTIRSRGTSIVLSRATFRNQLDAIAGKGTEASCSSRQLLHAANELASTMINRGTGADQDAGGPPGRRLFGGSNFWDNWGFFSNAMRARRTSTVKKGVGMGVIGVGVELSAYLA
jgi:hypothetical protein